MTPTKLKFGPADHGRRVTAEELAEAEYVGGYKYEIIDGLFVVAPEPTDREVQLENWLLRKLEAYEDRQQDFIIWTANNAQVVVPTVQWQTFLEPDIALYQFTPLGKPVSDWKWEDVSPLVVAEVLVDGDPDKDLVRNVDLYFEVPSIAEYWILDGRENPDEPLLIARRRWGSRWVITEVPYGETYTTRTLPGFELLIDPRR